MRADARANRERILAAAEEVFGEAGAQASTEEVARRAGVGIATVFRHFPTKLDLVEATLVRHFELLTEQARTLASGPDPVVALRELVAELVLSGRTKVTMANLLTEAGEFPPAAMQASAELRSAVAAVLRRAQDAGGVRPDVGVDELYLLIRGLAQAGAARPVPEATLQGALAVVLAGLGLTRPVS